MVFDDFKDRETTEINETLSKLAISTFKTFIKVKSTEIFALYYSAMPLQL